MLYHHPNHAPSAAPVRRHIRRLVRRLASLCLSGAILGGAAACAFSGVSGVLADGGADSAPKTYLSASAADGLFKRPERLKLDVEEHFIYALKDCIDGIIDEVIGCKNKILYRGTEKITQANIEAFRGELYTDLFGHKRGIRFQTDSEKIMAHGFDIKTSFRNVK